MTRKLVKPYVKFVGHNSTEVTGSANLIKFLDYSILVDYGLRQTSNDEEDYKVNCKRHKDIKPKQLTAIILTHSHIDHCGLIPSLFKDGANCPIYVPRGCKKLLTFLWQDTVHIWSKDYERFNRKPIYEQHDVDVALSHIKECDLHQRVHINQDVCFEYYNAKHIVRARQVYLELKDNSKIYKLGFTGDISINSPNYYLNDFESLPYTDLVVGECTYSNNSRIHKKKDRKKDCEKIEMAISQALKTKSKILIPVFSMDRLQNVLTTIYDIYDGDIPIKILVDTPLGINISSIWKYLIDKNQTLWNDVCNSPNIRWITDFKDTLSYSKIDEPFLIIAGGGMLSGGRATYWIKKILNIKKNRVIFCGYSTPESVAGMIKSGKLSEIKIDGEIIHNKASISILNSFSSHADYDELMKYYTTLKYNKIALVHSNFDDKIKFSKELKNNLSKVNRTSKVVATNQDTKIIL